jgi:hypothetical protein
MAAVATAVLLLIAAPAFAAEVTISVPTHATIPVAQGSPDPIVQNVWAFDSAAWQNGAVLTGSPATGGGSGTGTGGGVGGGGCIDLYGVINPNGNNLATMEMRGWIAGYPDEIMVKLTPAEAQVIIDHALAEGFITQAQHDLLLLQVVNSQGWGLYHLQRCLGYHEPAGAYTGVVKAIAGTAWDEELTPFTYLDVVAMDVDYRNGLEFGAVMPGAWKVITGDFDFGGALPTAQNLGNVPLQLGFAYSKMVKTGGTAGDVITEFDLEFQASTWTDAQKEVWPVLVADQRVNLVKAFPICNRAKMNFSLHAPNNIQPGEYVGTFKLMFSKFL